MKQALASERERLSMLAAGDLTVRDSFSPSYDALSSSGPVPAQLFRLIGLAGIPAISQAAVTALVGRRATEVAAALELLVNAHLLQAPDLSRFQMHDLLRIYAAEMACTHETVESRDAALGRLLTWYFESASAAIRLLGDRQRSRPLRSAAMPSGPLPFATAGTRRRHGLRPNASIFRASQALPTAGHPRSAKN
jgi:hypothetical protein